MAICNRDYDASEQTRVIQQCYGAVATALVLPVAVISYPCNILQAKYAAVGVSGTPTGILKVNRFIVGSGSTVFLGAGTTFALQAVGTSGVQTCGLVTAGSTALQLIAGDEITWTSAGSNAAVSSLAVSLVLQATQDIRNFFGA